MKHVFLYETWIIIELNTITLMLLFLEILQVYEFISDAPRTLVLRFLKKSLSPFVLQ